MQRLSKFFCDPAKVVKALVVLCLSIGVLVYVYFQIAAGSGDEIATETSMLVTMNDYVDADAYIFRDETIIGKNADGSLVTVVAEGERVSSGQLIANIYHSPDSEYLQDELNRVNRRIEVLTDSTNNAGFAISDINKLDDDIEGILTSVYTHAADGNLAYAVDDSSQLLVKLNKRDFVINSNSDYVTELSQLQQKKAQLQNSISASSTPMYATGSGYFYSEVDGYEYLFDIDKVESITLDNFDVYASSSPDESIVNSGSVKIVNSFIWYMVCEISSEDMAYIKEGNYYNLAFPENRASVIKMELEKIISSTNSPTALVIFRANKLPGDFDYKRLQKAQIIKESIEGLSVPKKALRVIDGEEGVYVLVGDVVRFRAVRRIAEKDNYYIVEHVQKGQLFENDDIVYKHTPLGLYDNIIVSGKNLFDGKIIG